MISRMRIAAPIILTVHEQATSDLWARARSLPQRLVQRARIIQMAADGALNQDIARRLGLSRPTVQLWRQRFLALRLPGLEKDAPSPGRVPRISARKMAVVVEAQGISRMAVQRIWKQHHLKPHLVKTFKLSRDKQFVEKLTDVVGLYLNPPDKSLVLCVDEKSQIQALDRTQPGLPLKPGRCGTMTHDYRRNSTTTLFAALSLLDGKVIGDCMPRHRHQESIWFLKKIDTDTPAELDLHLIVDNCGTHRHPRVKTWLRRHRRFHLHFTPTSSSWLSLVERWLRELADKRIRRGSFRNVPELIAAIKGYLDNHNQNPRVFTWTASVENILTKVAKCKEALGTLH